MSVADDDGDGPPWFEKPVDLLPIPSYFMSEKTRARKNPALPAVPASAAPKRKLTAQRKCADTDAEASYFLPTDRALHLEGVTPIERGRVMLQDGRTAVVPQRPEDFPGGLKDEQEELLLVELSAPITRPLWLEDREAELIYLGGSVRFIPLQVVRDYIKVNIDALRKPVKKFGKLKQIVKLSEAPGYLLTLVAVADILAFWNKDARV